MNKLHSQIIYPNKAGFIFRILVLLSIAIEIISVIFYVATLEYNATLLVIPATFVSLIFVLINLLFLDIYDFRKSVELKFKK